MSCQLLCAIHNFPFLLLPSILCVVNFIHKTQLQIQKPRPLLSPLYGMSFFFHWLEWINWTINANQTNMGHFISYLWGINVQSIHVYRNQTVGLEEVSEFWWLAQLRQSVCKQLFAQPLAMHLFRVSTMRPPDTLIGWLAAGCHRVVFFIQSNRRIVWAFGSGCRSICLSVSYLVT